MKNYVILKKIKVGVCHNLRKLTLDQKEWFLAKSKKTEMISEIQLTEPHVP